MFVPAFKYSAGLVHPHKTDAWAIIATTPPMEPTDWSTPCQVGLTLPLSHSLESGKTIKQILANYYLFWIWWPFKLKQSRKNSHCKNRFPIRKVYMKVLKSFLNPQKNIYRSYFKIWNFVYKKVCSVKVPLISYSC